LEFSAGIYYDDQLRLNRYSVSVQLCTLVADSEQLAIAMDRLKMFVHAELADTVFINQQNLERAQVLSLLGMNITTLPDEPIDQIVGIMLYCKFNSIMEDRMIVEQLDIGSTLGDNVFYIHEHGDAIGPFQQMSWWQSSDTSHDSLPPVETSDNVFHVPVVGWSKYNLNWPDELEPKSGKTVSFGKLNKNAN